MSAELIMEHHEWTGFDFKYAKWGMKFKWNS